MLLQYGHFLQGNEQVSNNMLTATPAAFDFSISDFHPVGQLPPTMLLAPAHSSSSYPGPSSRLRFPHNSVPLGPSAVAAASACGTSTLDLGSHEVPQALSTLTSTMRFNVYIYIYTHVHNMSEYVYSGLYLQLGLYQRLITVLI